MKKITQPVMTAILTSKQEAIIRRQIRRNSQAIDVLIDKIDLVANKEKHPKDSNVLRRLRHALSISIDENNTFRKVLWQHVKACEQWRKMPDEALDPITFLVRSIRTKRNAEISAACRKSSS